MLEFKRLKAEKAKVGAAREEMEFQIAMREAEIERLRENIHNQAKREAELEEELKKLKS